MTSRLRASTSRRGERLGVVVVLAHRVRPGRVLVQDLQVQLVGPPVLVRPRPVRRRASGRGWPGSRSRTRRSLSCLGCLAIAGSCSDCVGRSQPAGRSGCARRGGGAPGAQAPVDDLGLVDHEAVVVRGGQAGRVADGAVDVGDGAARPADDVVVVVADPGLVAGHRAGRLDAADQAGRRSAPAARRRPPGGTRRRGRPGRAPMIESVSACGCRCTAVEHRDPGPGHPQPRRAQHAARVPRSVGTARSLAHFLESIKSRLGHTCTGPGRDGAGGHRS